MTITEDVTLQRYEPQKTAWSIYECWNSGIMRYNNIVQDKGVVDRFLMICKGDYLL
jgi:hypothetical protein